MVKTHTCIRNYTLDRRTTVQQDIHKHIQHTAFVQLTDTYVIQSSGRPRGFKKGGLGRTQSAGNFWDDF